MIEGEHPGIVEVLNQKDILAPIEHVIVGGSLDMGDGKYYTLTALQRIPSDRYLRPLALLGDHNPDIIRAVQEAREAVPPKICSPSFLRNTPYFDSVNPYRVLWQLPQLDENGLITADIPITVVFQDPNTRRVDLVPERSRRRMLNVIEIDESLADVIKIDKSAFIATGKFALQLGSSANSRII